MAFCPSSSLIFSFSDLFYEISFQLERESQWPMQSILVMHYSDQARSLQICYFCQSMAFYRACDFLSKAQLLSISRELSFFNQLFKRNSQLFYAMQILFCWFDFQSNSYKLQRSLYSSPITLQPYLWLSRLLWQSLITFSSTSWLAWLDRATDYPSLKRAQAEQSTSYIYSWKSCPKTFLKRRSASCRDSAWWQITVPEFSI